jgi:hypothetical protein
VSPLVRNILIVVAAAAVITALGSTGSNAGRLVLSILSLLILAGLLYFGYTLYRDNRTQIQWLPQKHRLALYGAAAVAVIVLLTSYFWAKTFATSVLMFVLLGVCAYVIYKVWQEGRRYY